MHMDDPLCTIPSQQLGLLCPNFLHSIHPRGSENRKDLVTKKKALMGAAWNVEPTVVGEAPELGRTPSFRFVGYIAGSGLCPRRKKKLLKDFKCSRPGY